MSPCRKGSPSSECREGHDIAVGFALVGSDVQSPASALPRRLAVPDSGDAFQDSGEEESPRSPRGVSSCPSPMMHRICTRPSFRSLPRKKGGRRGVTRQSSMTRQMMKGAVRL
eukprot:3374714-Pyramimonas_sp.AAC.1